MTITAVQIKPLRSSATADTTEVIPLEITVIHDAANQDGGSVKVVSLDSKGGLLGFSHKGPFKSSFLPAVDMPDSDVTFTSKRIVYVRPGPIEAEETWRVRIAGNNNIQASVQVKYEKSIKQAVKKFRADGLYGVTSSFFDELFEDDHLVSGFWDGMSRGAEDLRAKVNTASLSSKIFQIPIYSQRRWVRFDFGDDNVTYDAQRAVFGLTTNGFYQLGSGSNESNSAGWHNETDGYAGLVATGPSGFLTYFGTQAFTATQADRVDFLDGLTYQEQSPGDDVGVVKLYRFTLRTEHANNLARLFFQVNAMAWSSAGTAVGVLVDIWNSQDDTWETKRIGTTNVGDPGGEENLQFGIVTNVEDYVDAFNRVHLRVRTSSAATGGNTVFLRTDRTYLSVGTSNKVQRALVSPAGTPITKNTTQITVRAIGESVVYTEGVDYYVDYDNDTITWLLPYDSEFEAEIIFDGDFPYVYSVSEELVSAPQLVRDLVLEPTRTLKQGVNYVIRRRGKLRMDFQYNYPGQTAVMWAPKADFDERLIYKNFGYVTARLEDELSSELYLRRIQGLWYAFWTGPSVANMESGAQILMNAPFAFEDSRVERIEGDVAVLSSGQVATKPGPSDWIVKKGDRVSRYQPLTQAVRIIDRISQPGFLESQFASGFVEDLIADSDLPLPVARAMVEQHFFTAEIDGFALAAGGATVELIRQFLLAIKPVYTFMGLGVVLRADCGNLVEGPCGYESDGNCLCIITPPPYDLECSATSALHLDASEVIQRWPRINSAGGAVNDFADLPVSGSYGEAYYVRGVSDLSEQGYYVWYDPQSLPVPDVDLGHYRVEGDPDSWLQRDGYPMDTWYYRPDEHRSEGGLPSQWLWKGGWVRVIDEQPFDMPLRANYKERMDVFANPDRGTSNTDIFSGTAVDEDGADIVGAGSESASDASLPITLIPGNIGRVNLSNSPVTYVLRVQNVTTGLDIPKWHFDVDRKNGRVLLQPEYTGVSWQSSHLVSVWYRKAVVVDDLQDDEVGYSAAANYTARADLERQSTVGQADHVYDEVMDLDGDYPAALAHSVRITQLRGGVPMLTDKVVYGQWPLP